MKKNVYLIVFMAAITIFSVTAQENLITNIPGRETTNLNGKWKYLVDQIDDGSGDWNGLFKDSINVPPDARVEYSYVYADWLYVPGDWNSQKCDLLRYEGVVWYRKRVDYYPDENKRQFIHFDGANYHTTVYVNGNKLGVHVGGFTPFNFEISDYLKEGENSFVVRVDNTRLPEGVPTMKTDWWNYGGITRDVNIIEVNETFVQDYFIQLKKGSQNVLKAYIKLDKEIKNSQEVNIKIAELDLTIPVTIDGSDKGHFEQKVDGLDLWSPENPKLYDVQVAYGDEIINDQIGFRTIEVKGADILLNGKSVFLRGISIHEENPMRGGRAYHPADAEMLLGWAKDLNCNMVRLAHYPHNQHMLRAADRLGLLVWEELPVYWNIEFDNPETYEVAENQLHEAILRDKNRASIIIWSMANETRSTKERDKFVKNLFDFTRSMDDTRLVSAASYFSDKSTHTDLYIDDPFGEFADIMSLNIYNGWYTTHEVNELDTINFHYKYDKPVFFSEFGAGAQYGNRGDKTEIWTEDFQAWYYGEKLKLLETIPEFRGCSPWILADFRSPRRWLPNVQDDWNKKGVISERGMKKKAFYVLQKYYLNKQR